MGKTLVKTAATKAITPEVAEREPPQTTPPVPLPTKSTTPKPFEALCIVARHFRGKPAAWLELRKLLDRVSHDYPPERFHQEFKELLARGK